MSIIDDKYSAYKSRQSKRKWAIGIFIFFFILAFSSGFYVFLYERWFYNLWIMLIAVGILLWFMFISTRKWSTETYETAIFVNFYEAGKHLQFCRNDNEMAQECSEKAYKKTKKAILELKRLLSKISSESHSRLLKNEFEKPLKGKITPEAVMEMTLLADKHNFLKTTGSLVSFKTGKT